MAIVRRKISAYPGEYLSRKDAKTPGELREFAEQNDIELYPLDIERLARALGLTVSLEPMDDDLSGYLEKRSTGWVLGVNNLHHPKRQRFTIAHELAHYFLHRNKKDRFDDEILMRRTKSKDTMEQEADKFAGELLMPSQKFKEMVGEGLSKLSDLSEYFGASMIAIKYKANLLGYRTRP